MIEFNSFENIKRPKVLKNISIIEWVHTIKTAKSEVENCPCKNTERGEYDAFKETLPAIAPNFHFTDSRKNKNIRSSTGILYLDIDDENFDIEGLDLKYVAAYFKSLSGQGYAIYVRVENLVLDSFSDSCKTVAKIIGISEYVDSCALKATQPNVLSYDPNAYLNLNCDSIILENTQWDYIHTDKNKKKRYKGTACFRKKKFSKPSMPRLDNKHWYFHLIPKGEDCLHSEDGLDKVCVNMWAYKKGNRQQLVSIGIRNLIACNLDSYTYNDDGKIIPCGKLFFSEDELKACLWSLLPNTSREDQMSNKEFSATCEKAFREYRDSNLNYVLDQSKRKTVCIDGVNASIAHNKNKENVTIKRIRKCIDSWDWEKHQKITQLKISRLTGLGYRTVQDKWSKFKEDVRKANKRFKTRLV